MKMSWRSYQTGRDEDAVPSDEEEIANLLSGYGSMFDPDAKFDAVSNVDLLKEPAPVTPTRNKQRRWMMAVGVLVMYTALVVTLTRNHSAKMLSSSTASDIELLGKSKVEKTSKKDEKTSKKDEKTKEKETKKMEKIALKEKKKEEQAIKKEEEKKKKEDEKKKKEEEKKEELEKKKLEEKKKMEIKKTTAFEPTPYPGCETVNVTYVKTLLPFWDHEFAANASGCHLASIHSFEENTKLSKEGLFKMALGPEIALSFMSGKPLSKVFWIGGYHFESDIDDSEWTDDSVYDFGPYLTNATEGCLSSSFNFTEIAIMNLTYEDHWAVTDCETPLPAIYKCCIKPVNATLAPEAAVPSEPAF
ncbi:hypothetical protein IV203_026598 [Nitzschia inconspicua]|uniref:C-type lectin domain-containing protein n=1 Tax=Nitzschia inconspicua TaxID=303405 RepID=A0A9K3PXE0_9STRA|nr:hypothetical protein IV203_026598 [Nitzschia inconspicua]